MTTATHINKEMKVGELVSKHPQLANVFDEYRIDFCCGGGISLAHAADKKQINLEELVGKLEVKLQDQNRTMPDDSWRADALVNYIEDNHHEYVSKEIPLLQKFLNKLEQVHGERHPELIDINRLFAASASDLTAHMKKEELMAFPLIIKLEKVANGEVDITDEQLNRLKNSITELINEHENEGRRFDEIAALSDNFTPPEDACNTYMVTFRKLAEFQRDLHRHIHLENNILFKKAERLLTELD